MSAMKFLLLAARNPGDDALEHEQLAFGEILEIGGEALRSCESKRCWSDE